jgi:hypothetical protein
MSVDSNLMFSRPQSAFEPNFWEELYNQKLNVYHLTSEAIPISAFYSTSNSFETGKYEFNQSSFQIESRQGMSTHGTLMNFNTLEVQLFSDP